MQRNCTGQEVLEDLSSKEGHELAIKAVQERYPDGIDILICNAGVGPTAPPKMIFALNFFACVDLAEGLRPLLKKKRGNCVITSSNRIFYCMPLHRQPTLAFPDPWVSRFPTSGFLQICSRLQHPCLRLYPSHYRADLGLAPVRNVRRQAHYTKRDCEKQICSSQSLFCIFIRNP